MKKKINISILLAMTFNFLFTSLGTVYATEDLSNSEYYSTSESILEEIEESNSIEADSSTEIEKEGINSTSESENSELENQEESAGKSAETNDNIDSRKNSNGKFEKYVTITSDYPILYENISDTTSGVSKSIKGQTFYAKEIYYKENNHNYLSLYDNQEIFIGFIDEKSVSVGSGKQGVYQKYEKFVTVTNKNYLTYQNFSWLERGKSEAIFNRTFEARGRYHHFNGLIYLSIFDSNGEWFGYINENATTVGNGRQGVYQPFGKYVTIKSKNYSLYSNFSWSVRSSSSELYGKTLHARGKYEHFNGLTYLSLFDSNGKWYGYINQGAVSISNGRQGAYQNYNKYVTVTNNGYQTYRNFSWTKLNETKNMFNKTYHAKGKYEHFNGLTYLSLFDSKGAWYGYVNINAVSIAGGKQGIYQPYNKHIIVNSRNYDMWQNFDWQKKQSSANLYNKGLIAKGKYEHFNGLTYYSLYDGNGKWQGYINSNGVKLVNYYEKPTTYYSQMSIGAWYGCAAVSLYTSLKAKGYANNVSLIDFINGLPLSTNNPDVGQIGDPWGKIPFRQVISPIGLNNYAKKYTNTTEVITGSSTDKIITEVNSGNIVLFWGRYLMQEPNLIEQPQHVMIVKGYKVVNGKEYLLVQDPGLYTASDYRAIRWFEKGDFDSYLNKKHRKMMVIR
ncbi:C39 family peptidase [Vagococcus fluvialis]|uniref:C39 family peptidase n=1 Tax=Vagococcus fluvialis TaxID=2738 RepID=UPI003D0E731B